jgi:hypothetical protein
MTLGATLMLGTHSTVAKPLALPELMPVVALMRLTGGVPATRRWPAVREVAGRVSRECVWRSSGSPRAAPGSDCGAFLFRQSSEP